MMQHIAKLMRGLALAVAGLCLSLDGASAEDRYAVLFTIDGLRWEDLFRGADPTLVDDPAARAHYVDVPDRAAALAPFLLSFAQAGVLIGDRDEGSCARVANEYWFSYPGYAEMLAGRPNPAARSNQAIPNEDITVLERLARRSEFQGQVSVYAEWDVVPAILNVERSGIPVFVTPDKSSPHDPQVMRAAREIFPDPPRLLWIALGDTDNRAHEGDYEAYLRAASEADAMLRDLWRAIESNPRTAGRTTLIVTADHGRGEGTRRRWRGHGSGQWRGIRVPGIRREGSDAVFIGALGPGIVSANAYTSENCATLGQVAATLLKSLDLLADEGRPDMAAPLAIFDEGRVE